MSAPSLDVVVNCAAYTDVDRAEIEQEHAFSINADGARNVACAAAARGLPVIQLSTDYVYAGTRIRPNREDTPVAPVNAYGISKAAGDAAVAHCNPAHLQLRVSSVSHTEGFLKNNASVRPRAARARCCSRPNRRPDRGARYRRRNTENGHRLSPTGVFRVGCLSFRRFAKHQFSRAGDLERTRLPVPRLVALRTNEYPTIAARPMNSTLDCSQIYKVFGVEQPDWHASLSRVMAALEWELQMKGIVLAGGTGSRLWPITGVVSKQLLPVHDKPMIYYPLSTLMLANIREIMVISTPHDAPLFKQLLGDGSRWGLDFHYAVQPNPGGLAQAFLIGRCFINGDRSALVLGDNILCGDGLMATMRRAANSSTEAVAFARWVREPNRYGVIDFMVDGRVRTILEKPEIPPSNYVLTWTL